MPDVVRSFGGRFLARAGKVTPLAGAFVPERAVLIEFPTAGDALAFYTSERYAPLLKIRLATTEAALSYRGAHRRSAGRGRAATAEATLRQQRLIVGRSSCRHQSHINQPDGRVPARDVSLQRVTVHVDVR